MGERLAALIVTYESGAYAVALAEQVLEQWRAEGRAREELELAIVDNASPGNPARELAALRALGARVVVNRTNQGYAAGMNAALAQTHGGPGDLVLVLNPDLALFPGALARLLRTARESAEPCALGPRAFLDPARDWRMPPNRLPTPEQTLLEARALHEPALAAELSAARTRHALREWTAREPVEVEMLSGACLLLSRAAIARAGGLFDERYPLYFEDTDLFRRLARAGAKLVLEPRAEIVHHWARSSGIERADPEPARRQRISRAAYFARWFGEPARASLERADELAALPAAPAAGFTALGPLAEPPWLEFPRPGRWLVELALLPTFPLAAGALVEGSRWRTDPRAWEWFYRGRYFVRALDPETGEPGGAWTFDQPAPARTKPLEAAELVCDSVRP